MNKRIIADIGERFVWTFIQGTTSTLLLAGFLGTSAWKAAVVGGLAAVIALVKGMAAVHMGNPATAATLPAALEATAAVAGSVTGTVVDTTGQVLGEVTGIVGGVLGNDPK